MQRTELQRTAFARLGVAAGSEAPEEIKFSVPDSWSRQLFIALVSPVWHQSVSLSPMRLYMSFRHTEPPVIAAAKARFSVASAYRIEQDRRLPSQKAPL